MWVAGKSIQIKRGKGYVRLNPGDPVPEAATWPNVNACQRIGEIVWKDDPLPTSPTNKELKFIEHIDDAPKKKSVEKTEKKKSTSKAGTTKKRAKRTSKK